MRDCAESPMRLTSGVLSFRGEPSVSFGFNFNYPKIDNIDNSAIYCTNTSTNKMCVLTQPFRYISVDLDHPQGKLCVKWKITGA